ncbi:urea carboxylase-associated family protein [Sulfurovum sp. zt1-1]|uniref:Urea carboxylase-associated family protein n=1 Tax=Sulfurovum zhangzhouensis TaxID=3019067 RepID=A0ABT7QYQ0_9BACT|nr:urea amidolyase associated protein UAAP1 [Sulfurovum zhangzhouensis]MDM5271958.1 urea carboxylase-associated family protein [Sulfurovum zhangzhouensis]
MITEHKNLKLDSIILDEVLPGGARWSKIIKRGDKLRITTEDGLGSLSAMFYNADNTAERFNSADTVKIQYNAYFGKGRVLYSELGRVLFSITEDTTDGLFDAIAGISNPRIIKERFGEGDFEHIRNRYYKSDRENFLVELGKYGMGKRDMIPAINFFRKVDVKEGSRLELSSQRPKPGSYIELRAEMNVLLVLSNTPHVMEEGEYNPSNVQLTLHKADPVTEDDLCVNFSPQSKRAFINNARYFA